MKANYLNAAGALALTFTIAACVPSVEPPLPAPTPAASPAATPSPAPAPAPVVRQPEYENYLDAPQTPGSWSYAAVNGGTIARYGPPDESVFAVGCMASSRRVVLIRENTGPRSDTAMTIRTETSSRTLAAQPDSERTAVSTALDADDPLLDAMAITKGRFAVETPGLPTLYIPAWVEVSRVIEDCR